MNKRGRPKNRRAGCLLCKPHKANGVHEEVAAVRRKDPVCTYCLDTGVCLVYGYEEPCGRCNQEE